MPINLIMALEIASDTIWPGGPNQVQIIIPQRSPASVPEQIGTPSDGILHRFESRKFVIEEWLAASSS